MFVNYYVKNCKFQPQDQRFPNISVPMSIYKDHLDGFKWNLLYFKLKISSSILNHQLKLLYKKWSCKSIRVSREYLQDERCNFWIGKRCGWAFLHNSHALTTNHQRTDIVLIPCVTKKCVQRQPESLFIHLKSVILYDMPKHHLSWPWFLSCDIPNHQL